MIALFMELMTPLTGRNSEFGVRKLGFVVFESHGFNLTSAFFLRLSFLPLKECDDT